MLIFLSYAMTILQLDHLVMTLAKLSTLEFYRQLGFDVITFGQDRYAIMIGQQKINIHFLNQAILPHATNPPDQGSADLCFEVSSLQQMTSRLTQQAINVELGPVTRNGARGPMQSLYIRDPEGNFLEFCEYTSPHQNIR